MSKEGSDEARGISLTRQQVGWYLLFRLITVTLLLISTVVYQFKGQRTGSNDSLRWLFFLVATSYAQNLLSVVWSRFVERYSTFVQIQILWDLLFATFFIYLTGGVASPFVFLFILLILSAAGFFSRRESLIVASASAILYGSLLDLQYFGYLPIRDAAGMVIRPDGHDLLYALFANLLAFFLSALLGGGIADRLRSREKELARKEIDYRELDNLNRAVVSNIGNGVMTLTTEGRIRLFNRGAERMTGRTLVEVYDSDVRDIFPEMPLFTDRFVLTVRGEGRLNHSDGSTRIVGFATSLIEAEEGGGGGLVVFQDLTHLKEVEAQLRRNERLAAVGQLAAGLAHEIRNPLASISGAVQLLQESPDCSDDDRRLLQIVGRGSDRLNHLLSDFLRFARPSPPQLEHVDLLHLLQETADVARADPRFATIRLHLTGGASTEVSCDRHQIVQVLLNLLINAADAIGCSGDIWLEILPEGKGAAIEDSGPGIPTELRERIFDPFFSTKTNGTGLGLATVYSIVEAHGAKITIETGRTGGARFVIVFSEGGGSRGSLPLARD